MGFLSPKKNSEVLGPNAKVFTCIRVLFNSISVFYEAKINSKLDQPKCQPASVSPKRVEKSSISTFEKSEPHICSHKMLKFSSLIYYYIYVMPIQHIITLKPSDKTNSNIETTHPHVTYKDTP